MPINPDQPPLKNRKTFPTISLPRACYDEELCAYCTCFILILITATTKRIKRDNCLPPYVNAMVKTPDESMKGQVFKDLMIRFELFYKI